MDSTKSKRAEWIYINQETNITSMCPCTDLAFAHKVVVPTVISALTGGPFFYFFSFLFLFVCLFDDLL